jgi:predicted phosphate transport protein (TIGR00153 family)
MTGGWLSWVRANDKEIMSLLDEQVKILVKASSILGEIITDYKTLEEKNKVLRELEHEGDQLTHKLFTKIDKTFVTPIDKEDISSLTSSIDQVLDSTYGTSDRLVLFKISNPSHYMQELSKALVTACQEIHEAVTKLSKLNNPELLEHCKKISDCEHEGDKVYRIAIAKLFETNDPIEIIKFKEIYETLESGLDRCVDVADTIEDIALKYR